MYVDVPTNVSAMELMSSPDTPKSQILIWPFELKRMFDGLMSNIVLSNVPSRQAGMARLRTAMDYPVHVVQVGEPLEHCQRDLSDHVDVDGANLLVNAVQRALVHVLHADADVRIRYESAVEGDDV